MRLTERQTKAKLGKVKLIKVVVSILLISGLITYLFMNKTEDMNEGVFDYIESEIRVEVKDDDAIVSIDNLYKVKDDDLPGTIGSITGKVETKRGKKFEYVASFDKNMDMTHLSINPI